MPALEADPMCSPARHQTESVPFHTKGAAHVIHKPHRSTKTAQPKSGQNLQACRCSLLAQSTPEPKECNPFEESLMAEINSKTYTYCIDTEQLNQQK